MGEVTDVPAVLHIIFNRINLSKNSRARGMWCVFFEVDGKLTYWLMDYAHSEAVDELDAWRRFAYEWNAVEYKTYKKALVMGRNMDVAQEKLERLLKMGGLTR